MSATPLFTHVKVGSALEELLVLDQAIADVNEVLVPKQMTDALQTALRGAATDADGVPALAKGVALKVRHLRRKFAGALVTLILPQDQDAMELLMHQSSPGPAVQVVPEKSHNTAQLHKQ